MPVHRQKKEVIQADVHLQSCMTSVYRRNIFNRCMPSCNRGTVISITVNFYVSRETLPVSSSRLTLHASI